MLVNRSTPRSTVIPELAYPDTGEAITRLCDAFGFTLRIRIGDHRAQLNVGDGAVVLIEAAPGISLRSSVIVRVEKRRRPLRPRPPQRLPDPTRTRRLPVRRASVHRRRLRRPPLVSFPIHRRRRSRRVGRSPAAL